MKSSSVLHRKVTSLSWDWRDESGWWPVKPNEEWQPNARIGVGHIVQMLLEMLLFCSRLAATPAGDDNLNIEIVLAPTEGRELFSDFPRRHLSPGYRADIHRVRLPLEVSRTDLLAKMDDLTADAASRMFAEFDFKPSPSILREFMAEVRR